MGPSSLCVCVCWGGGINSLLCAVGAFGKARISEATRQLNVLLVIVTWFEVTSLP